MWSVYKKRLKKILQSETKNGNWSLGRSEEDDFRRKLISVNESSEQRLSPVSDEHKHQYGWLFVLKLKGNCRVKPLMLQLPFNQARTTEMQMLTMAARHDLPQTNALSLKNLCSPDETEHFCQIQSAFQHQLRGICSDTSRPKDCH